MTQVATETVPWNSSFINKYDTFIFDCDGVVWKGGKAIENVKETLSKLLNLKKKLLFLSNNATKTLSEYSLKFSKLFDLSINENFIFTSGIATGEYITSLNTFNPKTDKILLIGSNGLYNILKNRYKLNILWTNKDINNLRKMSSIELANLKIDPSIKCVVVSMDLNYNYNDVCIACRYLNEVKNIEFVATNNDSTFPIKDNIVLAGTGSLVASVQFTSPIKAKICGKPYNILYDLMKIKHKLKNDKCLMVGDRLNTDIVFGINNNIDTLLTFTGVTKKEELETSKVKPKYVIDSIGNLFKNKNFKL